MNPLYAVTVVFNPRRFKSRVRLYNEFAQRIKDAGVEMVTVEIAFGERPFEVTNSHDPWHLQLRTRSELWHKERALNLGVQHLGRLRPDWKYFTYLDADVNIVRPDWPQETVHLLQHYAILQMFGEIRTLDPNHEGMYGGHSICKYFHENGKLDRAKGCGSNLGWPGLGWAYRREEFEEIGGLLDICVTGSGDTYMAGCYLGKSGLGIRAGASAGLKRAVARYGELCDRYVRKNVSYVPGLLIHYWHGKAKERGYGDRGAAIIEHQFDPHEDLRFDSQGLYKWHEDKWDLERALRKSMEARNEDSIDR